MRNLILSVLCLFAVSAAQDGETSPSFSNSATVAHALSALSVPFIENRGQVDNTVAFYAKSIGSTLYVTKKGEMVYQLPGFTLVERITGYTAVPRGMDPSRTNVSSFTGNDRSRWEKNLATYAAVSLGEISPGITVSLNAYGGKVEKIISVSPHTSPSIAFTLGGASSLGLGQAGELLVHTDRGNLTFSKPIAYQEINGKRVPVTVAYMLSESSPTYTFALGPYDSSHALTIDPILQSTYLGGSNPDYANVLAVGTAGVYVAGVTASNDFPGTAGGAQPVYGDSGDVFVALLTPDLKTLTQATYLGGSNGDYAYAIAVGTAGIYVAGPTLSNDFPGTSGGPQPAYAGGYCDAFVALLSPDLTDLSQATYLGGSNNDYAHALAIGPAGVYVAGYTLPDNFPGTAGGAQEEGGGAYDAFVALFTTDLKTLTQATYLGGFRDEFAFAMALGPAGVYVAGETFSSDFPGTTGGAQPSMAGTNNDVFVALLTTDLKTLTQATFLGANGFDYAYALAVGQAGVYVSGYTLSTDFPGTAGGAQPSYGGGYTDTYVALLSPGLTTLTQSTFLGGSDDDRPRGLAIGTPGVYVSGYTLSGDFPGTAGGAQATYGGGNSDSFVALLSPGLTALTQSTYLGGGSSDEANAIAIGPEGVYVAGTTGSANFPGTSGGAQPAGGGSGEAFVALLSPELGSGCYLSVAKSGDGSVTSAPPGINCGDDCSESYPQSTVVTLTAQADPGATLIGWSGACSGTNPQCVITMNSNLMVEATFSLLPRASVDEGSIGTEITLSGSGFGIKKGKVLIGGIAPKIPKDGWADDRIVCLLTKVPPIGGPYDITITPNKSASPMTLPSAFTVKGPEIDPLAPDRGAPGTEIIVTGKFFSTKKGKVYIEDPVSGKKKTCKVTDWFMEPTNGDSTLTFIVPKLPKPLGPGDYTLKITNKLGIAETIFTVEALP